MSVQLEIRDGNPWYLSPDIWTVPGSDPEGPQGLPIAGSPVFLWATVRNNGSTGVDNATVRFYWANPSVGFDRNTANAIGTSFVTLAPGQASDVLCLTPWVPTIVNGGHECVLAEAFHASDPLPGSPDFNVPTDRHVAQRNLSVVAAAKKMFHLTFEVHNASRKARLFSVAAKNAEIETLKNLVPHLGKDFKLPRKQGQARTLGFVQDPCPDEKALSIAKPRIDRLELPPGGRAGLTLVGTIDGDSALINVEQSADDRVVGGLAVLVIAGKEATS